MAKTPPKTLKELQKLAIKFRDARDWKQFHNPKDLALSIMLEAGELAEHFQWKNAKEIELHIKENRQHIADEMADVLNYLLTLANDLEIDLAAAAAAKLAKNDEKYPVAKAKGRHTKYTQL